MPTIDRSRLIPGIELMVRMLWRSLPGYKTALRNVRDRSFRSGGCPFFSHSGSPNKCVNSNALMLPTRQPGRSVT